MSSPPKPVKKWGGLLDWLNEFLDWTISIQPLRSEQCEISETPSGRLILPRAGKAAKGGGGGGGGSSCELQASLGKNEDDENIIIFQWGRIAGRQPTGFSPGGVPPYEDLCAPDDYFYAGATYDWPGQVWNSAFIFKSTDPFLANTATTAYSLLAIVGGTEEAPTLSSVCGPVTFEPCVLMAS